jgi:hypothetical protein
MNVPAGKVRVRNFSIDDDLDRAACETVLTKYDPLGRVLRQKECYDKEGRLFIYLQWIEDATKTPFRE